MEEYSISLEKVIKEYSLEVIYQKEGEKTLITKNEVSRPGLALSGFFGHFEPSRIQIIGKGEAEYITSMAETERLDSIRNFMSKHPVAVIYTSNMDIHPEVKTAAEEFGVPLLRTGRTTSEFQAALIAFLYLNLAPRITRHGVLVDVYGEGLFITGDSGIGKSETAIELVKRGHRFIADDAVEIKKVSSKTLVGAAPPLIKYFIELRGIGIVDVRRIFGMGAVRETKQIDLIINLEHWVQGKMYDRFGLDTETTEIMGIVVPSITIPVHPGRNLAIILEIAAMNNRQKKMGYNTAEEFNKHLLESTNLEEEI